MVVKCPNCGWSEELAAEAVQAALAAAAEKQADHHIVHCPTCQWVIRVSLDELKAVAPVEPAAPEVVPFGVTAPVEEAPAVAALAPKKPRAARKPAAKKAPAKKAAKPKAKKVAPPAAG